MASVTNNNINNGEEAYGTFGGGAGAGAGTGTGTGASVSAMTVTLSDDGDENALLMPNKDFLQDRPEDMTLSRRIAVYLGRRYKWYNPHLGHADLFTANSTERPGASADMDMDETSEEGERNKLLTFDCYPFTHSRRENPSIEKAWAYFEHVTLPRFIVRPKPGGNQRKPLWLRIIRKFSKANKQMERAEAGESRLTTKLYDPVFTPHKQLGDWGLGMGLYFSTLRALVLLTFLAGLINYHNFKFFASEEYSKDQFGIHRGLTRGSAICTDTEWVVCEKCKPPPYETSRCAVATDPAGQNITFILKNNCNGATIEQAMINFATVIFVIVGIFVMNIYMERMAVAFDEDEQTAQDYSILIVNPPGDATDPDEWRKFFYDNFDGAQVTVCTIAVDNDALIRTLAERRDKLKAIELMLEPGTPMDTMTLARLAAQVERKRRLFGRFMAMLSPGIPELFGRVVALNSLVQGLAQMDFPATRVFVTFEKESHQRLVLDALSVGHLDVKRNNAAALASPTHLFRGNLVLGVAEPDEPNTVRWSDLNETIIDRLKQQASTTLATLVAIVCIAFLVDILHSSSVTVAAYAIAFFNSMFPEFAKVLTSFEAHASEGSKQRSLYFKISVFRWVNTAIVITIIMPFTDTLRDKGGLIPQIYALFMAEIVTNTAINLSDVTGHINRHFLAPRGHTQDAMNLMMKGLEIELAERYTNMTKLLFLALFYSSIYPGGLLMCSLALTINYGCDKFNLMRTWKRAPNLSGDISEFSRRYFFPVAVMFMVVMSSFYWAGFPFDDLCENVGSSNAAYLGEWTLNPTLRGLAPFQLQVSEEGPTYHHCAQNFFTYPKGHRRFPFVAANQIKGEEWMEPEQATATTIYGWAAVVVLLIQILSMLSSSYENVRGWFESTYDARGKDQGINFSNVESISAYIPEVHSSSFSYPLLAADVDNIGLDLLEWTDPDRPHSYYDLTKDAAALLRGLDMSSRIVFSQVKHWPPEKSS